MGRDSNGLIQTQVERVDVVNPSLYNEKSINTFIGNGDNDTNYVYQYRYIPNLECVFTYGLCDGKIDTKNKSWDKRGQKNGCT